MSKKSERKLQEQQEDDERERLWARQRGKARLAHLRRRMRRRYEHFKARTCSIQVL
jgi:hypothetical protein